MSSSTNTAALPSYPGTILHMHSHPARKHLAGTDMAKAKLKEPVIHNEPVPTPKDMVTLKPVPKKDADKDTIKDIFKDLPTKEESFVYIPTGNTTLNRFSSLTTSTKRVSYSSVTKSELRQSNHQLFEMLQDVQTELATHRTLLADIQSRLSFLEHDAPTMVDELMTTPIVGGEKIAAPTRAPPPPPPRRPSSLIAPGLERQSWWQACQNFAENCDTPFSAQEFLGKDAQTPFDDFDFHFGGLATGEGVVQRPEEATLVLDIEEVPALSPSLSQRRGSDADAEEPAPGRQSCESMESENPSIFSEGAPRTSGLTFDDREELDNIIEQIVEFKKPATLPPLLLHPPPTSRASLLSVEEITALPDFAPVEPALSVETSRSSRKSMRKITSRWASLKGRGSQTSYYHNGAFSFSTR
ncbi:hypothetical protein E8E13_002291 [Curvularia kusanoi]|uniref:Uncharacterized protein n=1 Tax=Curvularia kusanoi TaxID=90978 RepID=A0A9P4W7G1_CURKU|nr:hypothetical protein E8E13_002291 [Curvularia kusanoi]